MILAVSKKAKGSLSFENREGSITSLIEQVSSELILSVSIKLRSVLFKKVKHLFLNHSKEYLYIELIDDKSLMQK